MSIAIYAASLDPITLGHINIIDRALHYGTTMSIILLVANIMRS